MNSLHPLAVTVDIEDWYHIPSVCGSPFSVYRNVDEFFRHWKKRYDYLTEPTERVLKILEKNKIRATFFIVADVAEHYPGLIESIAEAGHEIACHGLHHECIIDPKTKKPLMDKDTFKRNTIEAKHILEKISGQDVIGYRAPNALIGGWMIDVLEEIGFRYDSSVCVNSLYNKSDSNLAGITSAPYFPQKGGLTPASQRNIIEFPWAYLSIGGFKIPASGGPMLRFLGKGCILSGLQQSRSRGISVFYFHPVDISDETFPAIGKNRPFYWIIKGKIVEKRIQYIIEKTISSEKNGGINTLGNFCDMSSMRQ